MINYEIEYFRKIANCCMAKNLPIVTHFIQALPSVIPTRYISTRIPLDILTNIFQEVPQKSLHQFTQGFLHICIGIRMAYKFQELSQKYLTEFTHEYIQKFLKNFI